MARRRRPCTCGATRPLTPIGRAGVVAVECRACGTRGPGFGMFQKGLPVMPKKAAELAWNGDPALIAAAKDDRRGQEAARIDANRRASELELVEKTQK